MKRIQQGFTLIELMIVVAIIGILAAVAIPAYQDYIVKAKLSKVVSTLDPVKTALAMYFQEQGGFPDARGSAANLIANTNQTVITGLTPGNTAITGQIWASLGFGNYPSLPNEVASMALDSVPNSTGGTASNIAIILQLQNVKAVTVDGMLISLSPNVQGGVVGSYEKPTSNSATTLVSADSITGASAIQWYYGCKAPAAGTADAVAKNFFKNGNIPLIC